MEHGLQTGWLTDVMLPVALAVIMFGMGLGLRGEDFRRVARAPRGVLVGLLGQVLVLPFLGLAVAFAFRATLGFPEAVALGLLLAAACPGGTTSNLLTFLARADVALSVSLTSVSSLLAWLTTPALFLLTTRLYFGDATRITVSFPEMAALVAAMVVVPILLGMGARRLWPGFAARSDRAFRLASAGFLALVIAAVIYDNRAEFWALAARAVPGALALNVLALGAGLAVGWAARLPVLQARAVSIEVGFQNGTLGIALALSQLDSSQAAIVPGFYSLVMFATGAGVAWAWARDARRRNLRPAGEGPARKYAVPLAEWEARHGEGSGAK